MHGPMILHVQREAQCRRPMTVTDYLIWQRLATTGLIACFRATLPAMNARHASGCFMLALLQACGGGDSAPPPGNPPPVSGLDSRPSNTSCLAGDAPSSSVSLGIEQVYAQL